MDDNNLRLLQPGIVLPCMPSPVANYSPASNHTDALTFSGKLPRSVRIMVPGQIDKVLSINEGVAVARMCETAFPATVKVALGGDLGRIERSLTLNGFANATDDLEANPQVIDCALDLNAAAFEEAGQHCRKAAGLPSFSLGAAVEASASFAVCG